VLIKNLDPFIYLINEFLDPQHYKALILVTSIRIYVCIICVFECFRIIVIVFGTVNGNVPRVLLY